MRVLIVEDEPYLALLDVARNDPNRDTGDLVGRLHAVNTRAIDPWNASSGTG